MLNANVTLSKQTTTAPSGRRYTYWLLRWFATDGSRQSQILGRAEQLSKRQAEKQRRLKETELQLNPGRRDQTRAPTLEAFLADYAASRQGELAVGTLELHRLTARYLLGHFGKERRLDTISRNDARSFKSVLSRGDLKRLNQRQRVMKAPTVALHIRNARTIFGQAVEDDLIPLNPFDRLAGSPIPTRDWHYVGPKEFEQLLAAAPNASWKLLLTLARWAALRRGEALNLEWHNIDWVHNRLRVIGRDDWQTKDRQARVVPVCPELSSLLLDAFEQADEKQGRVIPPGVVVVKNISRDFDALCRRAGVVRYPKPLHTLRKSCITDWASRHPGHVVKQWAGHSDMDTTEQYYLQVSEAEYEQAAATPMSAVVAKKLAKNHPEQGNEPRKDNRRQSITNGD